jgi:hypothetical protein
MLRLDLPWLVLLQLLLLLLSLLLLWLLLHLLSQSTSSPSLLLLLLLLLLDLLALLVFPHQLPLAVLYDYVCVHVTSTNARARLLVVLLRVSVRTVS